ncbi:hypothetical protein B1756_12800 [Natrarchaeobaculum aegyptiacum]|uniref:Uncharacterized protein n=1 Tax=Natrarchaeobaculum aegyptiacum TaxID=745377 RepID=A0A2Z2HXU5_9EURY|nr:hypothetical protein B1756_12800 [Natrarchaeobaculum aegyptiacum]
MFPPDDFLFRIAVSIFRAVLWISKRTILAERGPGVSSTEEYIVMLIGPFCDEPRTVGHVVHSRTHSRASPIGGERSVLDGTLPRRLTLNWAGGTGDLVRSITILD